MVGACGGPSGGGCAWHSHVPAAGGPPPPRGVRASSGSRARATESLRLGDICPSSAAAAVIPTGQPSPPWWTLRGPEVRRREQDILPLTDAPASRSAIEAPFPPKPERTPARGDPGPAPPGLPRSSLLPAAPPPSSPLPAAPPPSSPPLRSALLRGSRGSRSRSWSLAPTAAADVAPQSSHQRARPGEARGGRGRPRRGALAAEPGPPAGLPAPDLGAAALPSRGGSLDGEGASRDGLAAGSAKGETEARPSAQTLQPSVPERGAVSRGARPRLRGRGEPGEREGEAPGAAPRGSFPAKKRAGPPLGAPGGLCRRNLRRDLGVVGSSPCCARTELK